MRSQCTMLQFVGVIACASAVVVTAACGTDGAESAQSASTVTVTQSDVPTSAGEQASSEAPSTPVAGSAAAEATASAASGAPIMRFRKDANVNANDFYGPGAGVNAKFFQSPSGNVRCGIDFDDPQIPSGCQASTSVRSNTGVTCLNRGNSVYSTQLISGAAVSKCVNQPFFVGGSGNPGQDTVGGRVLQYGQIISVGGTTCESAAVGISCWANSVGFTLARDRNDTYDPGYGQR